MTYKPGKEAFSHREWELIESLRTPMQVQRYLSAFPYNWEREGGTLRSFRQVLKKKQAHCLEAALVAAVILEQHGYPPLLLSLASKDLLDHVIFIFRGNGLWGSVARSRDVGLHGRHPVFRTLRQLAWSYFDPYVDYSGRLVGYGPGNLYDLGNYDWRFSPKNTWKVENYLREIPHLRIKSSNRRYTQLLARFKEFRERNPNESPAYFDNRHKWMM